MLSKKVYAKLFISKVLFLSVFTLFFVSCDITNDSGSASGSGTNGSSSPTAAQLLLNSMQLGWNLGNSLDTGGSETSWGNPEISRDLFKAVADAGFKAVRIPVTWVGHMGASPSYTIDSTFIARVAEVVNYALDEGLYVIINVHHDGADGVANSWLLLEDAAGNITESHNAAVEKQFKAVWAQIADYFKDYSTKLLFESMNEIHVGYDAPDSAYYPIINNLNQVFVDLVRESGGNNDERFLVVPGYNTDIDYTLAGFEAPEDSIEGHLILTVHYYAPWPFAGAGTTQVWGSANEGSDSWGQESYVKAQFNKLKSTYIDKGLPVIFGEYGAVNQTGYENYRRYYMEYVTKYAHDLGITPFVWDNNSGDSGEEAFGFMNRSSNTVRYPDIVNAMVRAVSSDYELADIEAP